MRSRLGFHTELLGMAYQQQGDGNIAHELFQRALANYRATVGSHYHRIAHVCVKLAEYHAHEYQLENAT